MCFKGCRVACPAGTSGSCYSTTEACGGPGASSGTTSGISNLNIQRLSLYDFTPVSGFLSNACVLRLGLLFFLFISGSARHDDDDENDDTRTNSTERYDSIERAGAYNESWVSQEAGASGNLDNCRSLAAIGSERDVPKYNMTALPEDIQVSASKLKRFQWIEKIGGQCELQRQFFGKRCNLLVVVRELYCSIIPLVTSMPHDFDSDFIAHISSGGLRLRIDPM